MIEIAGICIPTSEIELTYCRSSGPGGQNVNKVNSKAQLRWNALQSVGIPPGARQRFLERYGSRLTSTGDLILQSDQFRDRGKNARDCIERLKAILDSIARPPKIRRATQPTKSSQRKRVQNKRAHSDKKRSRSGRLPND